MTKTQINLIKSKFIVGSAKLTEGYTVRATNGEEYSSIESFIIWNDSNEICNIIFANNDPNTQAKAPYEIVFLNYSEIISIHTILSNDNLKQALDIFVSDGAISNDQKSRVEAWSKNIRNQNMIIPDKFYDNNKEKPYASYNNPTTIKKED